MGFLSQTFKNVSSFMATLKKKPLKALKPKAALAAANADPGLVAFLYEPEFRDVTSTHHKASLYDFAGKRMAFEFKTGDVVTVGDISPYEATNYYHAASKGVWYWDHIRVRGKGNAKKTRKPFAYGLPAGLKAPQNPTAVPIH